MTRILLLSDTHGNIDIINSLVEKTNTNMVIHAGDFGFYNESRMLWLMLVAHKATESARGTIYAVYMC